MPLSCTKYCLELSHFDITVGNSLYNKLGDRIIFVDFQIWVANILENNSYLTSRPKCQTLLAQALSLSEATGSSEHSEMQGKVLLKALVQDMGFCC